MRMNAFSKISAFAIAVPLTLAIGVCTATAACKSGNPAAERLGPNTCRQGYVWREAFGGDVVCVTPYERQQAKQQNP
jgi:hypothetical protein